MKVVLETLESCKQRSELKSTTPLAAWEIGQGFFRVFLSVHGTYFFTKSRHCLTLVRTCTYPGPIPDLLLLTNLLFACKRFLTFLMALLGQIDLHP
jgi:hypothetical protein